MFSFAPIENKIEEEWENNSINKKSLIKRDTQKKNFVFFDGPMFATSTNLHYGSILVSYDKDAILRYKRMNGNYVPPSFGLDCNGVPIEMKEMTTLGLKTRKDVLELGVDKFNASCRNTTNNVAVSFSNTIGRIGRWIDESERYMTMDTKYKESVIWVFKQLFDKGLVYKAFRVVPYSIGMTTSLSNFEASQNYKEVTDPTATVGFPVVGEDNTFILIWTTTPWTLPANLAVCTSKDLEIFKVSDSKTNKVYYMSEKKYSTLSAKKDHPYKIIEKMKGSDLDGKQYLPPFDYFESYRYSRGAFRVVLDDYVKDDTGTGFVHIAPSYGEDDMRVCVDKGIVDLDGNGLANPIDDDGRYTDQAPQWMGKLVTDKTTNDEIIRDLKDHGLLFEKQMYTHNYPFCYRTGTPLIYMARFNIYVKVTAIKDQLIENNKQVKWVPESVGTNRMHMWLKDARDWCVSRNRFWGTPIPIWMSDDGDMKCAGSIAEIEQLSGQKVVDLSKEYLDHLTFTIDGKAYKRCEAVMDCWFESGAMPYAQHHYPFENKEKFESNFPADFISESQDQVRGWFYTLLVLSTALFNKPAFKSVLVSGLILADNGEKMSKSKENFTNPNILLEKYGSDPMRLYLLRSPATRADSFKFKDVDIQTITKETLMLWMNAVQFLNDHSGRLKQEGHSLTDTTSGHMMDRWFESKTHTMVKSITELMDEYQLSKCIEVIVRHIEDLANWYIKLNRDRMKGRMELQDWIDSLSTLHKTLCVFTVVMCPFSPFMAEHLYKKLNTIKLFSSSESIHLLPWPSTSDLKYDLGLEKKLTQFERVVNSIRYMRSSNIVSLKKPVREVVVLHDDADFIKNIKNMEEYLLGESNILNVKYEQLNKYAQYTLKTNMTGLKARLLEIGRMKEIKSFLDKSKAFSAEQVDTFRKTGYLDLNGVTFTKEQFDLVCSVTNVEDDYKSYKNHVDEDLMLMMDLTWDDAVANKYYVKLICTKVQMMRKSAGLKPVNRIKVLYRTDSDTVKRVIADNEKDITEYLTSQPIYIANDEDYGQHGEPTHRDSVVFDDDNKAEITIYKLE